MNHSRATRTLLPDVACELLTILSPWSVDGCGRERETRSRFRVQTWNLRRVLRLALDARGSEDIGQVLDALARNGDRIQRAVVVWVDLVEVLVQTTERRYGAAPGAGKRKAAEVKEVIRQLLELRRFSLPNVPPELQPLVYDMVVEWTVDTIVLLLNRYGLWQTEGPEDSGSRPLGRAILERFSRILQAFWMWVAALMVRFRQRLQVRPRLSPELQAALAAIDKEGLLSRDKDVIAETVALIKWVAAHGKGIVASTEIVFAAVHEAEMIRTMTGPEKREYVRELVWEVLADLGVRVGHGLLFAFVDSMIGVIIDSSVHMFNKRGVFPHRVHRVRRSQRVAESPQ